MQDQEIPYKGYTIRVIPQPPTGDNTQIFFRVLKNDESMFELRAIWTRPRMGEKGKERQFIIKDGLEDIKKNLNKSEFNKGQVFEKKY